MIENHENSLKLAAKENKRFQFLDVLRGIAVLSVCIQHVFVFSFEADQSANPISGFIRLLVAESVDWGRFGVVLFFLISGFIIPSSLKPNTTLDKFFISRFFRLYPAYWVILAIIFISAPYLGQQQSVYSFSQFFANLTMAPTLFGINQMSGVFWTLFIEILFYGCCALLFKLKLLENSLLIGFSALFLNIATPLSILINKYLELTIPIQFVLFHLSFLFAGNLLRLSLVENQLRAKYLSAIFVILVIFTVPISSGLLFPVLAAVQKGFVMFSPTAVVYAYFLAIAIFVYGIYFKSMKNRFMTHLGEISYSLYLFHMTCFMIVMKLIAPTSILTTFFYLLLSAFFSYFVAKISFYYIEHPSIMRGKKIIESLNTRKANIPSNIS